MQTRRSFPQAVSACYRGHGPFQHHYPLRKTFLHHVLTTTRHRTNIFMISREKVSSSVTRMYHIGQYLVGHGLR